MIVRKNVLYKVSYWDHGKDQGRGGWRCLVGRCRFWRLRYHLRNLRRWGYVAPSVLVERRDGTLGRDHTLRAPRPLRLAHPLRIFEPSKGGAS